MLILFILSAAGLLIFCAVSGRKYADLLTEYYRSERWWTMPERKRHMRKVGRIEVTAMLLLTLVVCSFLLAQNKYYATKSFFPQATERPAAADSAQVPARTNGE